VGRFEGVRAPAPPWRIRVGVKCLLPEELEEGIVGGDGNGIRARVQVGFLRRGVGSERVGRDCYNLIIEAFFRLRDY
jgi:hypothetical protein